ASSAASGGRPVCPDWPRSPGAGPEIPVAPFRARRYCAASNPRGWRWSPMVRYLALLSALVLVAPASAQGVLFRARRATFGRKTVRRPAPSSSSSSNYDWLFNSKDGETGEDNSLAIAGATLLIAGIAVTSPIWVPNLVLESDRPGHAYFPSYPYALPNSN